jgi:hypothetical protein
MLNTVIQLVKKKKQVGLFLFSIILAIILTFLLSDTTFTQTQTQNYVLFLLFFAVCLWITEAVPPFSVSIMIVGFLVMIMGKSDAEQAMMYLQTWSDSVI